MVLGGLMVLVALRALAVRGRLDLYDLLIVLLGIFWIGTVSFLRDWFARRDFAKHPHLHQLFKVEISDEAIRSTSVNGTWDQRWSLYTKFFETKGLFVLYQGERMFSFLPKRAFAPGEADQFRVLARSKISPR